MRAVKEITMPRFKGITQRTASSALLQFQTSVVRHHDGRSDSEIDYADLDNRPGCFREPRVFLPPALVLHDNYRPAFTFLDPRPPRNNRRL